MFHISYTNFKHYRCADSESMLSCVKPKVLAYLIDAVKQDRLAITENLALVKSRGAVADSAEDYYPSQYDTVDPSKKLLRTLMLEQLDAYLSSHQLEAKLPEAIAESNIVPRSLADSMPKSLTIPLCDSSNRQQGNLTTNNRRYRQYAYNFIYDFYLTYKPLTEKKIIMKILHF